MRRAFRMLCLTALAIALPAGAASAGGGSENVLVVVNEDSWASKAVANAYVHYRDIPACNVVYLRLNDRNDFMSIGIDEFRRDILQPVLDAIAARGLEAQIDCIAYSADLPYRVAFGADVGRGQTRGRGISYASINGLTYLYRWVLEKRHGFSAPGETGYLSLDGNWYRRRVGPEGVQPPIGFDAGIRWSPQGLPGAADDEPGQRYMLSTVLGVTSGRGLRVNEAVRALRTAAEVDGTRPAGTVYYMVNDDVRSRVRQPGFDATIAVLANLGVDGRRCEGVVPQGADDIIGLMAGSPSLSWSRSGSKIVPGAICEHLTSWGGVMDQDGRQTPCTLFLRLGAAGSSGTVSEPMAIAAKFPSPMIHCYYAAGCSLAEAFYQSVAGPYQLLIVGDPLARPWARIPTVRLAGLADGRRVSGEVTFRPVIEPAEMEIAGLELYVDGTLRTRVAPEAIRIDTRVLPDGWHELRVVAVAADLIATRGSAVVGLNVDNHGRSVAIAAPDGKEVPLGGKLRVSASAKWAERIALVHNGRPLAESKGGRLVASVDSDALGLGWADLQAVAWAAGEEKPVRSQPLCVQVDDPEPLPACPAPGGTQPGLLLRWEGKSAVVDDMQGRKALARAGVRRGDAFSLEGWFEAKRTEVHQFQVFFSGQLAIEVDGKRLALGDGPAWRFVPVCLEKGMHRFRATGVMKSPAIDIRFGGRGAESLSAEEFRYVK